MVDAATRLAAVKDALSQAVATHAPPDQEHVWHAMKSLLKLLHERPVQQATEEPHPPTTEDALLDGIAINDDDDFNGVPAPTFSVGSPGPPPEEADLLNIGGRAPSIDDILGLSQPLGAAFDLLAPVPLVAEPSDVTSAPPANATPPASAAAALPDVEEEEEEEEPLSSIEAKIHAWADQHTGSKNLRALLATLHEVTPTGWGWEPTALSALVDRTAALRAYQRAILVCHPDKLVGKTANEQERGRAIFTALKRAQNEFKRT